MSELEGKILDRYELKHLIGKGGMADVYLGYDVVLRREIAVKVFTHKDEQMQRRFIQEAEVMSSLKNDHLVPVYDFRSSQIDGITWYYIIMPFMRGGTLRDRIGYAPLSLSSACDVLDAIADALRHVHTKGIVHRDIKSSNVLLDAEGRYYLSDFGIASINNSDLTQLISIGSMLGTPNYIAPELIEGNRKADISSDLYSLGVLLFEMITGQLPFSSSSPIMVLKMHLDTQPPVPSSIVPQIPKSIDHVILRALAKKPEQRYGSATELADAFRNTLANLGTLQQPVDGQMILSNIVSAPSRPGEYTEISLIPPKSFVPPSGAVDVSSTAPPPYRRRGRTFNVALTAFIVLLLVAISVLGAVDIVRVPSLSSSDLTATARSIGANAAASVYAGITATANVNATATAQAQAVATATVGPLATATDGTPSYADTLYNASDPGTQSAMWDGLDGNNNQCVFTSDGYHVIAGLSSVHTCQEAAYSYGDATISVGITIVQGNSGGLFLRFGNGSGYNGYLFEINSNADYKFSIFQGTLLQDWTSSSALKAGYNITNTVAVIMIGNTFAFYANGMYIATLSDPSHTYSSGHLAFVASSPDADTEVVFSNFQVWQQS